MAQVVLVVDDEPLVLDHSVALLEDLGWEVIPARHAAEALTKLAADKRITTLITDVQMPGMGGYELADHAAVRVRD